MKIAAKGYIYLLWNLVEGSIDELLAKEVNKLVTAGKLSQTDADNFNNSLDALTSATGPIIKALGG